MVKWGLDGRARRWVFNITVASSGLRDCVWTELYEGSNERGEEARRSIEPSKNGRAHKGGATDYHRSSWQTRWTSTVIIPHLI